MGNLLTTFGKSSGGLRTSGIGGSPPRHGSTQAGELGVPGACRPFDVIHVFLPQGDAPGVRSFLAEDHDGGGFPETGGEEESEAHLRGRHASRDAEPNAASAELPGFPAVQMHLRALLPAGKV